MRIMLDANVLFSAIHLPKSIIANIVDYIKANHTIVLCEYIVNETLFAFSDKFHNHREKMLNLNTYFIDLTFESHILRELEHSEYPNIRDIKDLPVLIAAIESGVDILITGDLDFDDVKIDKPRIMKPRQFQDEYMK